MNRIDLLADLRRLETIPAFKVLQPWASWILYRGKCEEIRKQRNNYRGIIGIVASGWVDCFDRVKIEEEYPLPYSNYALVALSRLTGCTSYWTAERFAESQPRHLNPPHFYNGRCYGWVLEDVTPIEPLYYVHSKNKDKVPLIPLQGVRARVRINVDEISEYIKCLDCCESG